MRKERMFIGTREEKGEKKSAKKIWKRYDGMREKGRDGGGEKRKER